MRAFSFLALTLVLMAGGCSSSGDGGVLSGPPFMTITEPTDANSFTTTSSSVVIGGAMSIPVELSLFIIAGVTNSANGTVMGISLQGSPTSATWEGSYPVPLEIGVNHIQAYADFADSGVSDTLTIVRE